MLVKIAFIKKFSLTTIDKSIFSGVAVISKNGKEICAKEIGFVDRQTKRNVNKYTLFNIGLLNKRFSQEIISQLVSENKLAYDDKLSKYLDLYSPEINALKYYKMVLGFDPNHKRVKRSVIDLESKN